MGNVDVTVRSDRVSRSVTVVNLLGMHARPAAELVKMAGDFSSRVTVTFRGVSADAESILSVLSLGAERGATLDIAATGDDAESAVASIVALIADGFSEEL